MSVIEPAPLALEAPRAPRRVVAAQREPPEFLRGKPWRVVHANCLHPDKGMAMLPDASVDHAIVDFPFSGHVHKNQRPTVNGDELADKRTLSFNHLTHRLRNGACREFKRLVRGWIVLFSDTESSHLWRESLRRAGLEYVRTIPWLHRGGTPQKSGDRPAQAHEDVIFAHAGGRKRWYGTFAPEPYDYAVVRGTADEPRLHEAQKPLALMERIVEDVSRRGDLLLDCAIGSGTTIVAAVRLGRLAIGWERRKADIDIAYSRLGVAREQLSLLNRVVAVDVTDPVSR